MYHEILGLSLNQCTTHGRQTANSEMVADASRHSRITLTTLIDKDIRELLPEQTLELRQVFHNNTMEALGDGPQSRTQKSSYPLRGSEVRTTYRLVSRATDSC